MDKVNTPTATVPRFDAFFTAVGSRRDDWQRLHGLAQAWAAATTAGRDAAKLIEEEKQLFAKLEVLENYYAYPGPLLMQRLRDRLNGADCAGFSELARRVARAVLGGTYHRDEGVWELADEDSAESRSRAPS